MAQRPHPAYDGLFETPALQEVKPPVFFSTGPGHGKLREARKSSRKSSRKARRSARRGSK